MTAAEPSIPDLVPIPASGRMFRTTRRVSIDDSNPDGRMELDAVFRFLQDAGNDDTDDAGFPKLGLAWIARKAVIVVSVPAVARELLSIATWCSGTGTRWAERRTRLTGEFGGHIDAATVWVHVDPESGRPIRWGDEFAAAYLESTGGRQVDSRLRHSKQPPPAGQAGVGTTPWRFRRTDMDAFGHVNNAAYLAALEEVAAAADLAEPYRVEVEWRKPSKSDDELTIVFDRSESSLEAWLVADDEVRVTFRRHPVRD